MAAPVEKVELPFTRPFYNVGTRETSFEEVAPLLEDLSSTFVEKVVPLFNQMDSSLAVSLSKNPNQHWSPLISFTPHQTSHLLHQTD